MMSQWLLYIVLTLIILSISWIEAQEITCGVDSACTCIGTNCQVVCTADKGCFGKTINCQDGRACNIDCSGSNGCETATINCPSDAACSVQCNKVAGCRNATINAGVGSNNPLNVECSAHSACYHVTIKGTSARNVTITECQSHNLACIGITIYCPPFDGGKQCYIDGDNKMGGVAPSDPITIYAINGWDDIQINALSKYRYGVMYCNSDYNTMCNITTTNNANDEWQCANTGGRDCDEQTSNPTVIIASTTKYPTVVPIEITSSPTKYPTPAPTADPTISPTTYPTPAPTVNPTALPTKYPTSAPTADPTKGPIEPDGSTFKPTITLCVDVSLSFDYIENVNDLSQQQIKHMISNKTKQFIEIELKQRADADDCSLNQYNHTVQIISVLNKAMVNITACFDCNGYKLSIDNNNNPDLEKEFVTLFNDNPILQISLDIVNDRDDEVETTTTNIDHFGDKERDKNKENNVGIIIGVLIGLFCCCIWITVFVWKYKQKQNVDNMKLQMAESSTVNATNNNNNNNNNSNESNQSKQIGEILGEDDTNSDGDLDGVVTAGGDDASFVVKDDEELIHGNLVTVGGDNVGFVVEDDEEVIGNTLNKVNSLSSDLEGGLSNVVNDEIIIGDDEENDIMTPKGNEILIDDEGDINHNIVSLGE